VIDQRTNKPVDLGSINSSMYKSLDPTLALNASNATRVNENNVRFYIVLGIVGLILICIMIVILIYVFTGSSASPSASASASATATATATATTP
jgi:hypothetical protein